MKKIFVAAVALALAFSVVAPVATSAQSMMASSAYSFNSNLTIGSTGSDVVALQSFLQAKGLLTIPAGVSKGYFGSLTQSAVSAYQVMKGITPTAGYFGPITRQAVEADMAAMGSTTTTGTTTTCPAGFTCAPTTPVTTPVCPAGFVCTPSTGTTTTTPVTSSDVEGTLNVALSSNPSDNANIRTQTDVPVYGIDFTAQLAPVTVQTVDLQVSVLNTNTNSTENPGTLINTIKVWDGTNLLQTVPVTISTFTKDQNEVYYYRFSNLNFQVPQNTTKTLTFTFSTNSIDVTRVVSISGYNSSAVRAVSGDNVSSFYDISGSGFTRTQTFQQPGTATVTLSSSTNVLRSQNYRNDGTDSLQGVVLGTFNLNAQTGAATLLTVNASTSGSVLPQTLYLYNGSTLLKSETVGSNGSVSFTNLDSTGAGATVAQDTIQTFTIKGDFPSNSSLGVNGASSTVTINSVAYEAANGSQYTIATPVTNAPQYEYNDTAVFALTSTPTIAITGVNQSGQSTAMTATFNLSVTALGGNVKKFGNNDFTVVFSNGNQSFTSTSTSVVVVPNSDIAQGSTAQVTVTAAIGMNNIPNGDGGLFNAAITSIKWNAGNGTTTQAYGLEDYVTSAAANFIHA